MARIGTEISTDYIYWKNVLNDLNLCKLFKTQIVFVESARRVKTFTICKKTDEANNFRCDNCTVAWIGTEISTN